MVTVALRLSFQHKQNHKNKILVQPITRTNTLILLFAVFNWNHPDINIGGNTDERTRFFPYAFAYSTAIPSGTEERERSFISYAALMLVQIQCQ